MHEEKFRWIRKEAKDADTLSRIEEIERDKKILEEDGLIPPKGMEFLLKLRSSNIWLSKHCAPSSIDMYFEIFMENHYMEVSGFDGKDANVVLDIGANEGYYMLRMKRANPNLKVFSVEPNPVAFRFLKKNIAANSLENIVPIRKVISSRRGKVLFQIVDDITTIGSMKIDTEGKPWLDRKRIREIEVSSTTLSDLFKENGIEEVDIMKLNVEGSELEILKSGEGIFDRIKKIVIEYHSPQLRDRCREFLENKGFKFVKKIPGKRGDIYFTKVNGVL